MLIKSTSDLSFNKINALIYGPTGYGKTTLASTLPPKTLLISCENGLLSLRNKAIDYVEIDTKDKMKSIKNILEEVKKSDYDTIFIDSLTEISGYFLDHAKTKYPDDRNTMQRYGLVLTLTQAFIKATRDMEKNVFYTCLEKSEKDNVGRVSHKPDLIGSIRDSIGAYFDFYFPMRIIVKDEKEVRVLQTQPYDGYEAKDRSGALDVFERPDLGAIINKVFTRPKEN